MGNLNPENFTFSTDIALCHFKFLPIFEFATIIISKSVVKSNNIFKLSPDISISDSLYILTVLFSIVNRD